MFPAGKHVKHHNHTKLKIANKEAKNQVRFKFWDINFGGADKAKPPIFISVIAYLTQNV